MKTIFAILALLALTVSHNLYAAHVECVISGTPTQQTYTAHFCSSQINSQPGVYFRLVADKPVAEVTWNYGAQPQGNWSCGSKNQCSVTYPGGPENHGFSEATACVTRVLYTDNTWENVSLCATGTFYGQAVF
ncbi:hypothetical protein Rhein_1916 [Rheinheimera sp. A13L]|uniref:hypothetical protein n=1 Tax=Rheinheimera sp. A13L TaxID=506534 RepID=UPI0002125116|nr:hypothetical protein [Rheinheimera sp. A13L]EGM77970.1 hypothetical protein Rhein_1916 [Rheinheimera sp. A13L]